MLAAEEIVTRAALYPRMATSGVIGPLKAIGDFTKEIADDGTTVFTLSVGRESMLPDWPTIHDYGCRVAVKANQAKERSLGKALNRPAETIHYVGSFKMKVSEILNAPRRISEIGVYHHPVDGLEEHCNIGWRVTNPESRRSEISAERTGLLAHLRLILFDPEEHICKCDIDLADLFSGIRLIADDQSALISTE